MADDHEPVQHYSQAESDSDSESCLPPKPSSSVFGESKLGETLVAQNLVLDFTPIDDIDNDIAQKKCSAFWDFINSRTDLHHLLVLPDEQIVATNKSTEDFEVTDSEIQPTSTGEKQKTAVSMLEVAEGKGLIDRIFEAKLPQTNCSLGSREYLQDGSNKSEPTMSNIAPCTCSKTCKLCRISKQSRARANTSARVQALCQKLQAWDSEHPKSMKPPGHAPNLTNCVMQRKVIM